MSSKAFFFDRDGIINERKIGGYITTPEEFVFIEDFFEVFQSIAQQGFCTIIITNQQGIGKGQMNEDDLHKIHEAMQQTLLQKTGYKFAGIYYCGDLDSSRSSRRKPAPGMIVEAIQEFDIDITNSWMIGDSPTDVQAGKAAGCKTILIGDYPSVFPDADFVFTSLHEFSEQLQCIVLNKEVEK